jgi:hypothetical protein
MSWLVDRKVDGPRWGSWSRRARIILPLGQPVRIRVTARWSTRSDGFFTVEMGAGA